MQSFFLYTNIGDSNKEGASEAGGRSTVRRKQGSLKDLSDNLYLFYGKISPPTPKLSL